MVFLAVIMGLAIGVTLGALGGGGSILTVPALVYVLGQNPHGATTASLVVVGATALAGALAHLRAGRVRLREGAVFGSLGIAGSVVGSRLSASISPSALLAGFSVLMLVAATAMIIRTRRQASPSNPPRTVSGLDSAHGAAAAVAPTATLTRPHVGLLVVTASGVGLLTGFFGVGGGFVVVPALVLVMRFDMAEAVATSLVVIAINSAASLVARIGTPVHVDWAIVGVFGAAAIGASLLGARLPALVGPLRLARAFSVLLLVIGLYTLVRSVAQL